MRMDIRSKILTQMFLATMKYPESNMPDNRGQKSETNAPDDTALNQLDPAWLMGLETRTKYTLLYFLEG